MDQKAVDVAVAVVERVMRHLGGDMIDGRVVLKAAIAGYMAGSGVPTDDAVAAVEQMAAHGLVSHVAPNPLYRGIPWLVAGPVSGAPYYR